MSRKKLTSLVIAVSLLSIAFLAWKFMSRNAYESADYQVLESESPFEIREYPDLMLATTAMSAGRQNGDGSFMRLFRYISGNNDRSQKVSMTTPVFMEADQSNGRMGFVIPEDVSQAGIPEPKDQQVAVEKRHGGKFAVFRFSGQLTEESRRQGEQRLRDWISEKGLSSANSVESAGYDAPWTPGPLRRNEVLIRLD